MAPPPNHHRRGDGSRAERWRSWLWVLAGVTGFALTALQPSVVVAGGPDRQLVAARTSSAEGRAGIDAARARLEEAGLGAVADRLPASSPSWPDTVDAVLAEWDGATGPEPPGAGADRQLPSAAPASTVPTTSTASPASTTTAAPATTTTTARASRTTTAPTVTAAPATPTTIARASGTTSTTDAERRFAALVDEERANAGLGALRVDVAMGSVARDWSIQSAGRARGCDARQLRHNPDFAEQLPPGWSRVGENVGCGPSVASIHQAFMASDGHRGNILDPGFTSVGIGVGLAPDGTMWVTQNFGRY